MSNLGFQAVYKIFAEQPGVAIDRAFLPEKFMQDRRSGSAQSTKVQTFESSRQLADCDVLAFSLSFETDYPHLVAMLNCCGLLTIDAAERAKRADVARFNRPIIIVGGTAVTLNPEPIADLVDIIMLGEAEEFIPEFAATIRACRERGDNREETLIALAQIEGVYVPRFYSPEFHSNGSVRHFEADLRVPARPQRRLVRDLSKFPTYSAVLTTETEFRDMFLVETGRGCEMGCRFCVAGYIYRPVRKRSEESLRESVQIGLKHSKAVGFVGASVSSHRAIGKLAAEVAQAGGRASLSSLMSQKITPQLAGSLSESEYKTVALAPEAGNERLRRAVGKRVSDEQVVAAAAQLVENGIRGFKLYFIIGLPTETDADIDSIAELAIKIRDTVVEASRSSGKVAWVSLSVNPFIPKASTPFQWEPMVDRRTLDRKIARIQELVRRTPNLELRFESPKESYFQALLSRGDRRVAKLLCLAEEQGKDWKWLVSNGTRELIPGVPSVDFFAVRRLEFDEVLPWDVVDSRIEKSLLKREALRSYLGEDYSDGESDEDQDLERELERIRATPELVETAILG